MSFFIETAELQRIGALIEAYAAPIYAARGVPFEQFAYVLIQPGKDGGKPDFFGAAPADAIFVSTSVVPGSDGDEAKVTGNLTLNGVTKPVTLDVDFHGAGMGMNKKETIGFQAETTIKRSDFGVSMGIPYVSDAVELEIHAAFEKQ